MINLFGQLTTAPLPLVQRTRPFHCIDGDYDAAAADRDVDNDITDDDFNGHCEFFQLFLRLPIYALDIFTTVDISTALDIFTAAD